MAVASDPYESRVLSEDHQTSPEQLEGIIALATSAAPVLAETAPNQRSHFLRKIADALDQANEELIALAGEETHLDPARLVGELKRTTFQLRMFGDAVDAGNYMEATIDHADPSWPPAPKPDIRRVLIPIGPALIFAASNFPFAFSVAGGDTASALAAGCPIILKAHPGHPKLSRLTGEIVIRALAKSGAPKGTFSLIYGQEAGTTAITDPRVRVSSFTGSLVGGRALFDLAAARDEPIPFYGELGSINPVFVTRAAINARRDAIAEGFANSFTMGSGQFCTKPGILFVPSDADFATLVLPFIEGKPEQLLLNDRIAQAYESEVRHLTEHSAVRIVLQGTLNSNGLASPTLIATTITDFEANVDDILTECFGPTSVLVTYNDENELLRVASKLSGQLTATIHGETTNDEIVSPLVSLLTKVAGRVLFNGWPTGVAVTWAMHHGGPYPATTSPQFTSVGTTAIPRFLRPVAYQDIPDVALPLALREDNPLGIPRRVDGRLISID